MRYSKQRELVLHTVEQLCDHPTAEEIFDKAAPERSLIRRPRSARA